MSEFRKVAKGAIWFFSAFVLTAAFGYLSKVFLARILGPSEYGMFVLSMTVAYILSSFTQSGVAPAVSYFIPKYRGKRKLGSILSTLFWVAAIVLFVIVAIVLIFPTQLASIFGEPKLVSYFPYIIVFLVAYTFTNLLKNILRSYENAKIPSLIDVLRASLFLTIGVALTYLYSSALTPLLVYIFIYILLLSILTYLAFNLVKLSSPNKKYVHEILLYSFSVFFVGIFGLILRWTDVWMISWFMDTKYVGIYNVATTTAYLLNYFIGAFMFLYFPIAARLLSEGKKKQVRELATKIVFWNSIAVAPVFFIIFLFSRQIINLLFGSSYLLASVPLSILVIGTFFRNIVSTSGNSLLALGRKRELIYSSLLAAVTNVILNYFLIPAFGLSGAALATTISIMVSFSLRYLYAKKYDITPHYTLKVFKPLIVSLLLAVPILILNIFTSISLSIAVIIGAIYVLLYLFSINLFVIPIKKIFNNVENLFN